MVTISDAAENATVKALLTTRVRSWIGFTDAAVEGTFVWMNGDPVTYVNWASDEPNSEGSFGEEDYVEIFFNGFWNDINPGEGYAATSAVVEFKVLDTDGDGDGDGDDDGDEDDGDDGDDD